MSPFPGAGSGPDALLDTLRHLIHTSIDNLCQRCGEERYQTRSVILTSQMPVARWHEQIGDPTVADGILDRLVHNAHKIEMRGDSIRKNRGKPERP